MIAGLLRLEKLPPVLLRLVGGPFCLSTNNVVLAEAGELLKGGQATPLYKTRYAQVEGT
jgi:hypothetical protein